MNDPRLWRHFDWVLLLVVVLLVGYGATMIYSATLNVESLAGYTTRQVLYSVLGVGVMIGAAAIDYRIWGGVQRLIYIGAFVVLGAVGLVVLPVLMVLVQPNFSTAILLAAVGVAMIYTAGLRWQHLAAFGATILAAVPAAWFALPGNVREDLAYVAKRLLVFAGLATYPDMLFNLNQALISIGSGGFLG